MKPGLYCPASLLQDEARVYGGLLMLRLMTRKYEFADEEKRGPLAQLINTMFPVLLQLFTKLLSSPAGPQGYGQVAQYQKLICKVFWSASFMGIPQLLLQEEQFKGWMQCFHMALRRPIPWVSGAWGVEGWGLGGWVGKRGGLAGWVGKRGGVGGHGDQWGEEGLPYGAEETNVYG